MCTGVCKSVRTRPQEHTPAPSHTNWHLNEHQRKNAQPNLNTDRYETPKQRRGEVYEAMSPSLRTSRSASSRECTPSLR